MSFLYDNDNNNNAMCTLKKSYIIYTEYECMKMLMKLADDNIGTEDD